MGFSISQHSSTPTLHSLCKEIYDEAKHGTHSRHPCRKFSAAKRSDGNAPSQKRWQALRPRIPSPAPSQRRR